MHISARARGPPPLLPYSYSSPTLSLSGGYLSSVKKGPQKSCQKTQKKAVLCKLYISHFTIYTAYKPASPTAEADGEAMRTVVNDQVPQDVMFLCALTTPSTVRDPPSTPASSGAHWLPPL